MAVITPPPQEHDNWSYADEKQGWLNPVLISQPPLTSLTLVIGRDDPSGSPCLSVYLEDGSVYGTYGLHLADPFEPGYMGLRLAQLDISDDDLARLGLTREAAKGYCVTASWLRLVLADEIGVANRGKTAIPSTPDILSALDAASSKQPTAQRAGDDRRRHM